VTHLFTEGEPEVKIHSVKFDPQDKYIAAGAYYDIQHARMAQLRSSIPKKEIFPSPSPAKIKPPFHISSGDPKTTISKRETFSLLLTPKVRFKTGT